MCVSKAAEEIQRIQTFVQLLLNITRRAAGCGRGSVFRVRVGSMEFSFVCQDLSVYHLDFQSDPLKTLLTLIRVK